MTDNLDSLRLKRDAVLHQMQSIDRLRRGCLSKQFFKPAPGQTAARGPYFILQGFFHGKKFNERIPAGLAPQVQEQVDNYRRFQALAEDYVTLSDQITRLEPPPQDRKKNSSRRRSPTNGSRKRLPS